jgi:hypothetical protein
MIDDYFNIIEEYKKIEKEENRSDSDEIFTKIIERNLDRNNLSSNQEYFVLIGEYYRTIKDYVRSTYE